MVVIAVGGGVEDQPHIPDKAACLDQLQLAGAQQRVVLSGTVQIQGQLQHGMGEDLVAVELATMGDEAGHGVVGGHAADPMQAAGQGPYTHAAAFPSRALIRTAAGGMVRLVMRRAEDGVANA